MATAMTDVIKAWFLGPLLLHPSLRNSDFLDWNSALNPGCELAGPDTEEDQRGIVLIPV
jgi:hypothetical protein